jgi:UDP-N-acetyl-D-glucosamine dehydrogenase
MNSHVSASAPSLAPGPELASLPARLARREAKVGIIGLGYVGLPLAMAFCEEGVRVIGIDVSPRKIATLNAGQSDVEDIPSAQVAQHVAEKRFTATADFAALAEADTISICVPTPLGKSRDPDISYIVSALESILPHLKKGQLVVLESTTYPGTTREVLLPRIEERGFRVGVDIALAFSPERIDPGNKRYGVRNTPKVVGGITSFSTEASAALYGLVCDRVVQVDGADTAEIVKLLENTFRAVNIGLVNEIAIVCAKLGIDVWQVVEAAATKPFGFMPFFPGPGLGGHCIPIDPLYLSWKLRTLNYNVRFIELADEVNRSMPDHVVTRVTDVLNERGKAVKGSRILLVGMAYKGGVGDLRESPALDVAEKLLDRGATLAFRDDHVGKVVLEHSGRELVRAEGWPEGYDLAVILTAHPGTDYRALLERVPDVLDTRNALRDLRGRAAIHRL